MNGQRIGYKRVSTILQNTERQLDGVLLDKCFEDKASGKDMNRPQLALCLDFTREGDTLVVHSMDRLARNVYDLIGTVRKQTEKGVKVEFLTEHLTFTGEDSPLANLMLAVLGGVAQFQRSLINEASREGMALAKITCVVCGKWLVDHKTITDHKFRNVYLGRKRSLSPAKISELRARVLTGEPKASLAREYKISRETLYSYLRSVGDSPLNGVGKDIGAESGSEA